MTDATGAAGDAPAALVLEAVSFSYGGRFALDTVGLRVEPGTFTALLGRNGAGKTTLFSLIARLFRPTAGRIRVCGFDLYDQPSSALACLGIVFQQPTLDMDLTVTQNLRFAASLHGIAGRRARDRIAATLDQFDLTARRGVRVRELSGGLRRRVELARALLHEPPVLLLDEASVGLDPPSRSQLVEDVHALARRGVTVLWATHLVDEVRAGDRVVVMHQGTILADAERDVLTREQRSGSLDRAFTALTADDRAAADLGVGAIGS